jgi:hypothetical protein
MTATPIDNPSPIELFSRVIDIAAAKTAQCSSQAALGISLRCHFIDSVRSLSVTRVTMAPGLREPHLLRIWPRHFRGL